MARKRVIKPDFWNDEKIAKLSRDSRLTFVGMWTASDDYGVIKGHPDWLKNQIFPYDKIKTSEFTKWLNEIENQHFIIAFQYHNETYYFIPNFLKHQKIDHPSQTGNPAPPKNIRETIARQSRDNRAELESNSIQSNLIKSNTSVSSARKPPDRESVQDRIQNLLGLYHEKCPSLPTVKFCKPYTSRHRSVLARMTEHGADNFWPDYFAKVEASDFLTGREKKWRASFDWIMNPTNMTKILEGNYDNRDEPRPKDGATAAEIEAARRARAKYR